SDAARSAVGRALDTLETNGAANERRQPVQMADIPSSGGPIEQTFERAVRTAFEPVLQNWVDGHHNEIVEQLKPIIREWMDDNLPALIENAVRNEIARVVRGRKR